MLDDLTLLLSHVLFYHLLWLVEKQVVHRHLLDFPVAVGQSGVGPLLGLMEPLGWVGFPD